MRRQVNKKCVCSKEQIWPASCLLWSDWIIDEATEYQQLGQYGACKDASNQEPSSWCKGKVTSQVCKGACDADSQCSHYTFGDMQYSTYCCLYGDGVGEPVSGWTYNEGAGHTQITKSSEGIAWGVLLHVVWRFLYRARNGQNCRSDLIQSCG